MTARPATSVARKIFLIATEESGDRLGANLMKVLRQRLAEYRHVMLDLAAAAARERQ